FTTTCYHMVGTGVVQCETGTDLSPLSEFKAADVILAARDARAELLSEDAVFLEAFMGFALDTIQASVMPSAIIDSMSFTMTHQLSEAFGEQGLQKQYEEIARAYASSLTGEEAREALKWFNQKAVEKKAIKLEKV